MDQVQNIEQANSDSHFGDDECESEKDDQQIKASKNLDHSEHQAVAASSDIIVSGEKRDNSLIHIGDGDNKEEPPIDLNMRERLRELTQEIVEEVNQKRQRDSQMIDDYKKDQINQVESFCNQVENHLFEVYKAQNREMQDKIQQIFDTLDRISKLETELQEFRSVLNNLYKEIMSA